jgi:hypothetical protein
MPLKVRSAATNFVIEAADNFAARLLAQKVDHPAPA